MECANPAHGKLRGGLPPGRGGRGCQHLPDGLHKPGHLLFVPPCASCCPNPPARPATALRPEPPSTNHRESPRAFCGKPKGTRNAGHEKTGYQGFGCSVASHPAVALNGRVSAR